MTTAPFTWVYNKQLAPFSTVASAFASSSLASSSNSKISNETNKYGDPRVMALVKGASNNNIYSVDKSSVGTENKTTQAQSHFTRPIGQTVPNVNSLSRSSIL